MGRNASRAGGEDAPTDDGLAIPGVGPWARRKYHFLTRYLDAFTVAMRSKWPELHYVDLFSGSGIARIKSTNELVFGSPLLAARLATPFTQLHVCDADPANVSALRHRLAAYSFAKPPEIVLGDANVMIESVLSSVPPRGCLCMTFADPFGLHLDFETVRAIASRRSDLVVLIADNMDALRNWAAYYENDPQSNLDRFMGEPGWRELLKGSPTEHQAVRLRKRYRERLATLGYAHFAEVRVQNSQDRDIYTLLYASKSAVGAHLWNRIAQIDESGQRSLPFGD
jgi:three-Cys-motif partner protein